MKVEVSFVRKKRFTRAMIIAILAMISIGLSLFAAEVHAASNASVNKKAHRLYVKKINSLKSNSKYYGFKYRYADVTGDGIHEVIVEYRRRSGGSGSIFQIYTYKNGKVKRILNTGVYGLEKITVYTQTKSLIFYRTGHGGEIYVYYRMKNGKYDSVATKGRMTDRVRPWYYTNSKGTELTKKKFQAVIKGMKKGKKKTLKFY